MSVRVRYAPSPTGYLHIGGLRTALYNYLFARHSGGSIVLRIEDTDRARYVDGSIEQILESFAWAGIVFDEGPYLKDGKVFEKGSHAPYVQSARQNSYRLAAEQLVVSDKAYPCFCSAERLAQMRESQIAAKIPPMYDGACRALSKEAAAEKCATGAVHVIRLKVPVAREIIFTDVIRGRIVFDSATVDDQVLIKSDGFPTYHLAVVVDDHAMEITHVIRGEEWLSSTPKHILLYEAFGWTAPVFAHLALLLNPDHSKLSKRQGDVAALDYARAGYLPEALINFIALLGWNPSDSEEKYSLEVLIEKFELTKVGVAGSVFNKEKLDWLNGRYLRALSLDDLQKRLKPFLEQAQISSQDFDKFEAALLIARERATTLVEVVVALENMKTLSDYSVDKLVWKRSDVLTTRQALGAVREFLENTSDEWRAKNLENLIKEWISGSVFDAGTILWSLRVALSGAEKSPPPFDLLAIYGKEESLRRIRRAEEKLSQASFQLSREP